MSPQTQKNSLHWSECRPAANNSTEFGFNVSTNKKPFSALVDMQDGCKPAFATPISPAQAQPIQPCAPSPKRHTHQPQQQPPQHQKPAHEPHSSQPLVPPTHQQNDLEAVQARAAHGEDVTSASQGPPHQRPSPAVGEGGSSTATLIVPAARTDVQGCPEQKPSDLAANAASSQQQAASGPRAAIPTPAVAAAQASLPLPTPSNEPVAPLVQDASNCSLEARPCSSKPLADSSVSESARSPLAGHQAAGPAPAAERMLTSSAGMQPATAPPEPAGAPTKQQQSNRPHAADSGKQVASSMLLSSDGQAAPPAPGGASTEQETTRPHAAGTAKKDAFSMLLSSNGWTGAAASPKPTGSPGYAHLPWIHIVPPCHSMHAWRPLEQGVCRLQPDN